MTTLRSCIFLGCLSQSVKMKELHNSTGHQQKHSVIFKKSVLQLQHWRGEFMNESVKVLSQRCYVSSRFFKWVYGNPLPLLVGIRRIPTYHVDYSKENGKSSIIKKYSKKFTFFPIKNIFNLRMNNKHKLSQSCEIIVLCNKNTSSANDSQATHKMGEKYTECKMITTA